MFNLYEFEKRSRQEELRRSRSEKEDRIHLRHVNARDDLARRYKKRVANFVNKMISEPQRQFDPYTPHGEKFDHQKKILGEHVIRHSSYRSEKERILDCVKRNALCESVPL